MAKLQLGKANTHVQKTMGADSDLMKFYCTQYATTYSPKHNKFKPQQGRHTGTGYLSNFRTGVYYSERLDELDNPAMGNIVKHNYHTITENSFRPYGEATGREPLPNSCKQAGSGFMRERPLNIPTDMEVRQVAIDTRTASAPAELMPRNRPLLHKLKRKDPVELENSGYGPKYMTSETQQKFKGEQQPRDNLDRKKVGPREHSGFTHNVNDEPVTFTPGMCHDGTMPPHLTKRPTGLSLMQTQFRPSQVPDGTEPLPRIANRSIHDTGFTNGTKAVPGFVHKNPQDAYDIASKMPPSKVDRIRKNDPAEYQNTTIPNNHKSVTAATYRGQMLPRQSDADYLGRTAVGLKEGSGYTSNNDRYVGTSDDPSRFITHYNTRFMDRTLQGADREGHTMGGVLPQQPDGFTRDVGLHDHGKPVDTTAVVRRLDPYVARSLKARDRFFDDHQYDSKLQSTVTRTALAQ